MDLESGPVFTAFAGILINMNKVEAIEVVPDDMTDGVKLRLLMVGYAPWERYDTAHNAWARAAELPGVTHTIKENHEDTR